jgi:stalled ribosome rescue protein Dom34
MKREVGLWIDHRKAVIVIVTDEGEEIQLIRSNVEKNVRPSDGPQDDLTEDNRERRFATHLGRYYDKVISCIRDAESILIFGPGEAKGELKKHLESEELHERIVGIETVDKMTERQIAAKVRQYFLK